MHVYWRQVYTDILECTHFQMYTGILECTHLQVYTDILECAHLQVYTESKDTPRMEGTIEMTEYRIKMKRAMREAGERL